MKHLAERAAVMMGDQISSFERLSGGDLSTVMRIELAGGGTAIVKETDRCATEAAMLDAISASGAPAPKVFAAEQGLLVMEDLGDNRGVTAAWLPLARTIRTLHACTGSTYGWPADYSFDAVPIHNDPTENWPTFWAEQRLLACVYDIPSDLAHRVEALCKTLGNHLPRRPTPVLLHGDLWTGNIVARDGQIYGLIDPACYYGHREVDLAMLCLFAQPTDDFWNAYGCADSDLEDRRAIYQLWPALVHLRLFGETYRGLVHRLLQKCGC